MKKSLNDIGRQFRRCKELNRQNNVNRIEIIIDAVNNARAKRGLSRFDKNREVKKEII